MKNKISFFADLSICIAVGIVLLYILFTYALSATLPIILGWLFSLIIIPISRKISSFSGAKEKFTRAFLCILFILIGFALISLALRRLFRELSGFFEKISSDPSIVENALASFSESIKSSRLFSGLEGAISHLGQYAEIADKLIVRITGTAIDAVSFHLSRMAEGAIAGIPTAFLFIITFILSSYYFSVDSEKISAFFSSFIPEGVKSTLKNTKKRLFESIAAYFKSSIILLFITFFEVFLGLFILRVKYPFIMALVVAVVDFLPILGAGLILIPWAIYCLAIKNAFLGVGLILLFILVTIVRKMLEPKIMAKKMGAHPLSIIGSVYIGFKLFGGWGLILAPIICSSVSPMLSKTSNMSTKPILHD